MPTRHQFFVPVFNSHKLYLTLTLGNGNMSRSLGPCRHEPMPKMLPPHPLLSSMHVHAIIHIVLASSELTARISSLLPTYFKLTGKYARFLFLQNEISPAPSSSNIDCFHSVCMPVCGHSARVSEVWVVSVCSVVVQQLWQCNQVNSASMW